MNSKTPDALVNHLTGEVCHARRRYCRRLERCRGKFSGKNVHALRIEMRRILALLEMLEELRLIEPSQKCRKKFKKLLDELDPLRDTQVQRDLLKPFWSRFPEAKCFKKLLGRREESLRARLRRKIKRAKLMRQAGALKEIEKRIAQLATGDTDVDGSARAVAALRSQFARVVELRRNARANNPSSIHRLRVAFKRFRYAHELFETFLPRRSTKLRERMKSYQNAAGRIQDFVVLLDQMKKSVADGDLPPRAVETLKRELLRQKRKAIELFMERIDDLFEFEPAESPAARPKTTGRISA